MRSSDDIGDRGESIFKVLISQPCGPQEKSFFRAYYLGEKKATLDFLVELTGLVGRSAYFFVQVKSTRQGVQGKSTRLRIKVKKRDIDRMIAYPGPTYLVGIDERNERGYVASIERPMDGDLHGLPITFPIDCESLQTLWNEVDAYWKRRDMTGIRSAFAIEEGARVKRG